MGMSYKLLLAILGVLVLVGAGFAVILVSPSQSNEKTTEQPKVIRMGNLPVTHGLPLYVALEKGYFKEAGLNVEVIQFEAPNQIIDALLQNTIDMGPPSVALGITGVANMKNPGKLKIYAVSGGTKDNPNENILAPADSTIKSIKDLKGKKLGILGGTIQWRTITRELLAQHELMMNKDVTIVELAPAMQVPALAAKQIDALLALEPMSTVAREKGAGKIVITAPVEKVITDPFYGGAGVITTRFAAEYPKTAKKAIAVIERAMREINKNPDGHKRYLKGYTPLPEEIIPKVPIVDFKSCKDLTTQDLEAIQKFYDIFTKHKVVEGTIDITTFLSCEKRPKKDRKNFAG